MDKNNIIRNTVFNVASNFFKQDAKVNEKLELALNKKFEKVELNENKYNDLLKYNILFYRTLARNLEPLIGIWITDKYIPNIDELERDLDILTAKCRKYINRAMKEDIKLLKVEDLRSFLSYEKMDAHDKRKRLEKDYKVLNLYKDLLNILLRKISLDRDDFDSIYELDYVEVRRELKKDIIVCVNKILSASKGELSPESFYDDKFNSTEDIELVSEDNIVGAIDTTHIGLNDVEVTFLTKLGDLHEDAMDKYIKDEYEKILSLEDLDEEAAFGFGKGAIKEFTAATVLLEFLNKKNKNLIEGGMRLVAIGEFGAKNFSEYIQNVVKKETVINTDIWEEALKIVSRNHEDIEKHEVARNRPAKYAKLDIDEYIYMVKNANRKIPFKFSFSEKEIAVDHEGEVKSPKNVIVTGKSESRIEPTAGMVENTDVNQNSGVGLDEKTRIFDYRPEEIEKLTQKDELRGQSSYEREYEDDLDEEYENKEYEKKQYKKEQYAEDEYDYEEEDYNAEYYSEGVDYNAVEYDEDEDDYDDKYGETEGKTSRSKILRDGIIAAVILVLVVGGYATKVLTSKRVDPSADAKNTVTEQKDSGKTGEAEPNSDVNKKDVSKKTEAQKLKEAEAEKQKRDEKIAAVADGKGKYYRVYAGSNKTEESAKETLASYTSKGIEATIVQSNGYYKINAGDYTDYSEATDRVNKLAKRNISTYIEKYDKYFDYKLEYFAKDTKTMSKEDLEKEYTSLKKELQNTAGAGAKEYSKTLEELYESAQ
ncbi:MAG: SPOR domain-containing protein [Clostridioides sp.]|jgi:cell division protein FtsN|nr:SPOR domain-containing protein [Clostridioides sp.]